MTYLLIILASIILFVLFLSLTIVEARTGIRIFAGPRGSLDRKVQRASFVIKHVNWVSFFSHALESVFERIVHDIAHWSLRSVRFMERQLSKVVRYLRDRRPNMLAPEPSREPIVTQAVNYIKRAFKR